MGAPQNPLVNSVNTFGSQGKSNNNMMLAGLKHQFSHTFSAEAQYAWAHSMDTNSGPYFRDAYLYNTSFSYGRSDFDVNQSFKLFGVWQPVIFRGSHNWVEKIVGGWSLSGISAFTPALGGPRSITLLTRSTAIPATTDFRTCVPTTLEELPIAPATTPSKQETISPTREPPIRGRTIINSPTTTSWSRTIRMRSPTIPDRPRQLHPSAGTHSQLLSRPRVSRCRSQYRQSIRLAQDAGAWRERQDRNQGQHA